jgi:hypothetical protein
VLILILAYHQIIKSNRVGYSLGGFLLGLVMSLKLPLMLMGIPILIYRRWRLLAWNLIGFIFGIGGSILISGIDVWMSYFKAIRIHGTIQYLWRLWPGREIPLQIEGVHWAGKSSLPNIIEGQTSILGIFEKAFSLNVSSYLLLPLATITLAGILLLYINRKKRHIKTSFGYRCYL